MRRKEIGLICSSLVLLLVSLPAPLHSQTSEYRVIRIDEPIALHNWPHAALNDSSSVVGVGYRGPFLWKNGAVTMLAQPDACLAYAPFDLNNQGVAVGFGSNCSSLLAEALRWTATSCFNIGGLADNVQSAAYGINGSGKITGSFLLASSDLTVFVYDGSLNFLPILGTGCSINDSDYVVGQRIQQVSGLSVGTGFLYRNGNIIDLPGFGAACGINNRNQVIGTDNDASAGGRAGAGTGLLWENGDVTVLGTSIIPMHINDNGTVVGIGFINQPPYPRKAWRWKNGVMTYLNDLIPANSGVDLKAAIDINNKGEILCQGMEGGSYYYYLLAHKATITSPRANDTWIAGEADTIRWGGIAKGTSLLIEFSSDSGRTYQAQAAGVPSDSDKYAWQIPKDVLSTKCFLRLRENSTLDSLAVSGQFKIKPYQLTRIDPATGDYVAYTVPRDQWGFSNREEDVWPYLYWYTRFAYSPGIDPFTGQPFPIWTGDTVFANAEDSDFPSWVSFVKAYTVNACYISLPLAVYSQAAVEYWGWVRSPWGGSCFGIAGTNALAFSHRESFLNKFPGFPLVGNPISVTSDTSVISAVSEVYCHQFGKPSTDNDLACALKTPRETLNDLRQMLRKDTTSIRTITISDDGPQGGAHTILAYKVDRTADDSPVWNVHVYDNSYPDVPDAIIEIDTSQNFGQGTWVPKHGTYAVNGWGGKNGIYLEVPSESYLSLPTLGKRPAGSSVFHLTPGRLEIGSTRGASIRIRDGAGNVTGCAGGQVWSDIPGSVPLRVKNGSSTPPYGYGLASGTYSIAVDSFKTAESVVRFFTENRMLGYRRSGADVSQTDNLHYDTTGGPALSIANLDPLSKSITLKNILNETDKEQVYTIHSLDLSQNDSLEMTNVGENGLRLASYGAAREYDLRVDHALTTGLRSFARANIPLTANTTHTIVPDWSVLGDGLLIVLIDRGNDGSVDDTLHLTNEATGVQGHGSLIPNEYRLEQNYPNPFNPLTTIRYGLPQKSAVRLTVYNMLGQEVATLVQEEQEVGYHEVRFDGSNLASGVYICRLQAGDFVQSRKLILLR